MTLLRRIVVDDGVTPNRDPADRASLARQRPNQDALPRRVGDGEPLDGGARRKDLDAIYLLGGSYDRVANTFYGEWLTRRDHDVLGVRTWANHDGVARVGCSYGRADSGVPAFVQPCKEFSCHTK